MDERLDTGSYILRNLIQDIALSGDGEDDNIDITCVELWGTQPCSAFCFDADFLFA